MALPIRGTFRKPSYVRTMPATLMSVNLFAVNRTVPKDTCGSVICTCLYVSLNARAIKNVFIRLLKV